MKCRQLKDYKGYEITKSWEEDSKGRIVKDSIIYDAVEIIDDGGLMLLDARKNLSELKKIIDKDRAHE